MRLAVAAVSARLLAEAAAREGHGVIALDLFGDTDTRRASLQWHAIGAPGSLRIDAKRLLDALAELAAQRAVDGWIAGSGFEGEPDLLERASALLPLLGTPAANVRQVRDARRFFGALGSAGIAHPEVRFAMPEPAEGWLLKDAAGCGGWHIRPARKASGRPLAPTAYFQRIAPGVPMSATFVAAPSGATVLGFNRQLVRRIGTHPYVYGGVLGPVALPAAAAAATERGVGVLAAAFGLRGLGSLDFLFDGEAIAVLELNPRPPASLALYPDAGGTGAIGAHLRACRDGLLPEAAVAARSVRGSEIVYARRTLRLDAAAAARLAGRPGCHDLPYGAGDFEAGDPVCSVTAAGADADEVESRLAQRRDEVLDLLETPA
jgi:predicted ATP-grasp superfamily ATP-dependent carboligase